MVCEQEPEPTKHQKQLCNSQSVGHQLYWTTAAPGSAGPTVIAMLNSLQHASKTDTDPLLEINEERGQAWMQNSEAATNVRSARPASL